jgi:hypothetical protein
MKTVAPASVETANVRRAESLKDTVALVALVAVAAIVYGALFNRESVLSYSIGYNLYSAERLIAGQVPYRDFHTLYPPATLYLNAALFKWLGVSLYTALFGVFVFKTLTVLFVYLSGRGVLSRGWALAAAGLSLVWLRPNGPFKAVPMHYGALFLALALWLLLKDARTPRRALLFAAGCALGVLATFKHNIGAYALIGALIVALLDNEERSLKPSVLLRHWQRGAILIAGFLLPVVPMLVYMKLQHALGAMTRALLFGPGEFLLNRLAAVPSPDVPLLCALAVAALLFIAARLGANRANAANQRLADIFVGAAIAAIFALVLLGPQTAIDKLIFYLPVFVILTAVAIFILNEEMSASERRMLLAVTVAAAAAFMEAFPRFAREQAIAAMPFVALLVVVLLRFLLPVVKRRTNMARPFAAAMLCFPVAFGLIGARLLYNTAFDGGLRFKSNTELKIARGRGVYFPAAQAREIESVVDYIQQRVPESGYFFPQSYAGSSYLFLADRRNPSGAQFWGGVGVSAAERAHTLDALDREGVNLIVTSDKDMAAERYTPLRDYIEENFNESERFGEVIILERSDESRVRRGELQIHVFQ